MNELPWVTKLDVVFLILGVVGLVIVWIAAAIRK